MGTKTEKDIIGEMAKEVGAIAEFSYLGAIDAVHEKGSFESPIERVMVAALMARPLDPFGCVDQIHDAFLAAWDRRKWS